MGHAWLGGAAAVGPGLDGPWWGCLLGSAGEFLL